jgi:hypothetical protein
MEARPFPASYAIMGEGGNIAAPGEGSRIVGDLQRSELSILGDFGLMWCERRIAASMPFSLNEIAPIYPTPKPGTDRFSLA